jgi:hypothetical protein
MAADYAGLLITLLITFGFPMGIFLESTKIPPNASFISTLFPLPLLSMD